jgi:hypothetical protein
VGVFLLDCVNGNTLFEKLGYRKETTKPKELLTFSICVPSLGLGEKVTFRLSAFGILEGDSSVKGDVVSPSLQEIILGASLRLSQFDEQREGTPPSDNDVSSLFGDRYVLYSVVVVDVVGGVILDGDPYLPPRRLTSPRFVETSGFSLSNLTCLPFGVGGVTVGQSPAAAKDSSGRSSSAESRSGVSKAAFFDPFKVTEVSVEEAVGLGDAVILDFQGK